MTNQSIFGWTRAAPLAASMALLGLLVAAALMFAPPPALGQSNTVPAAPANLSATHNGNTVDASWDPDSNATRYHVTYSFDNKNSWIGAACGDNCTANSYTVTAADPGKTYIVAVRAGNSHGWSGWVNSAPAPPSTLPPAAPSTVTVTRGDGTLTVSGYAVSNATKYHITYSSDNEKSWNGPPCGDNCVGTGITISGVVNAKTYIVSVRAGNAGGWSGWVNSAPAGPLPLPPAPPAKIWVNRVCDHTMIVWWDWSDGATGYDLVASIDHRQNWKRLMTDKYKNGWQFSAWQKEKTFWFAVRARNAHGESAWVNSAAAPAPPCAVGNLRAVTQTTFGQTGGSIAAAWDAGKRAAGYHVNHRFNGGQWQRIASNGTGTSHTWEVNDTGNYEVAVQSVNGDLMSEWRNTNSAWLSAGSIVGTATTLTLSGHGGDWWLQQTAPTTGTCTAGDSSFAHPVTGLAVGNSYTYTAYRDSACATALASANIHRRTLAVSNVTTTAATLTMAGDPGAWHVKKTAPAPDGNCSAAINGATYDLTSLNPGQSYTYTAYDDSACTVALLTVTFRTLLTVSNLGETTHPSFSNEIGYKNGNANRRWANAFTTGSSVGGYTLDSVVFEFGPTTGSPTRVHAKIYADSSGMPGSLVKDLGSENPTAAGNHTWTCSGNGCALASDTTYHVALEADAPTAASGHYYDWKVTASDNETNTPGSAGWTIAAHGNYKINAGVWTAYGNEAGKFQVVAITNPGLAVSNITAATATLTLSNYSGPWWLQRTNPADAACKSMGMTTTENLADLTVGQSYTYKAYDKSGCDSADEIGSVTFTTVGLTASSVSGADAATLTIAGYTGSWYVKQTAPAPAGSCSRAIHGSSHNLTGLTTGQTYAYTAYRGSGCDSADEIASVIFRVPYLSVSNLGETSYPSHLAVGEELVATAFTTGSATGGYALKSVTLSMGDPKVDVNNPSARASLIVEVRAASGSNPSATALTALSGANPTSAGQHTYVCSANCALAADTTYFLVLSAISESIQNYPNWQSTTSDAETADPVGNGWAIANVGKKEASVGSGNWNDINAGRSGKFKVSANAGAGLGVTNVSPTAATLNVSNHSGGWWYQGSQSNASCTSVTSGATTARVTGLSPTTSYAYTAYGKAGCNAADELDAPVTFRTTPPTLTPGTPTVTTVTLTIDGHSGNWHYQYTSPSGGTCSPSAVVGAIANVANLSKNQSYTFSAYSDSGCATLIATAPAFTTANPALTASNVISDAATLTLTGWVAGTGAGKDGNWHYQADAAPHTACSSAQTTGAATLSGLTVGGTYIYTAYSDSGCTDALATATAFTTTNPLLSVGSVARTSAALAMAHYAGNWHYQADSGPDNTCQGPVSGGTVENLTGLTADTEYTYRAYDKSGCASADELETLTFTTSSLTAGNMSQTDATNGCAVSGDAKCATGFTTGSATGGYLLTGVTARFNAASDADAALGDLVATLHASASNTVGDQKRPADAALATMTGSNPTSAGNHTFTCSGAGCVLAADTTYFVQLSATAGAVSDEYYDWVTTAATGQTLDPANNGWTLLDETDNYAGSSWTRQAEIGKLMLSVSTQPRLEATDVTVSGATLNLSLHSAAWWYQQTGSGNCASVNAGVKTATLSTLTAGTLYTYKAYDKSGCNSADEIASVTFTTFVTVTVSNLAETADGTLLGVTPESFEAVAFTTGVHPGLYELKSVTVKFGAPSYEPGAGPATVKIHAVGSDGNPAASHTYHLGSQDPTAAGDFTFNCVKSQTQTCRLARQTTYFVVIEGSTLWSVGAQRVTMTASGNQTNTPANAGWSIADAAKYLLNNAWKDENGITVMLKVTAETR